jgi:hypothetical protein
MRALLNWVLSFWGRVLCDRCKQAVEGFVGAGGLSGGVYVGWTEMMDPGEHVVCDRCMWADPRYQVVHGTHL